MSPSSSSRGLVPDWRVSTRRTRRSASLERPDESAAGEIQDCIVVDIEGSLRAMEIESRGGGQTSAQRGRSRGSGETSAQRGRGRGGPRGNRGGSQRGQRSGRASAQPRTPRGRGGGKTRPSGDIPVPPKALLRRLNGGNQAPIPPAAPTEPFGMAQSDSRHDGPAYPHRNMGFYATTQRDPAGEPPAIRPSGNAYQTLTQPFRIRGGQTRNSTGPPGASMTLSDSSNWSYPSVHQPWPPPGASMMLSDPSNWNYPSVNQPWLPHYQAVEQENQRQLGLSQEDGDVEMMDAMKDSDEDK